MDALPPAGPSPPRRSDRLLHGLARATQPLALAVTALLWLQWPLRDLVGRGAAQANDLAQALFALYVAVALCHAGRRGAHLVARPDLAARGGRWRRSGAALAALPWALTVALTGAPGVWRSLRQFEHFPETGNPGYFAVRLAMLLLASLLAAECGIELVRAWQAPRRRG